MQTLNAFFKKEAEEAFKNTHWFKTAPKHFQETATFKIIGVEHRKFHGMLAAEIDRPILIVECQCGDEKNQMSMFLDKEYFRPMHS
jgi:hypothetical protein